MPRIVMLWGAPAAGKTAISRAITAECAARGVRLPYLASDRIRAAISDAAYPRELREVVYDGLLAMAESAASRGLSLLLDANYLDEERRRQVFAMADRHGARVCSVLVRCGLEGRLARNRARAPVDRVPDAYVQEAHARAEAARVEADVVVDTDLERPEEAAAPLVDFLLGGD